MKEAKKVTIVCDENTLNHLFKIDDTQWNNFSPDEFMYFIGIENTTLTDEQMELRQ